MSRIKHLLLILAAACTLAGCASTSEQTASGLQVVKDDYDGSTVARQAPVNAGSYVTGDWNVLGFEWKSKFPNRVLLAAGTRGVVKIDEITIDIDGEGANVKTASEMTNYGDPSSAERWSMRRFEISWEDFERMAAARTVRLKIVGANQVLVTSFGAAHAGAPVNGTLPAFLAAVRKLRGEEPK